MRKVYQTRYGNCNEEPRDEWCDRGLSYVPISLPNPEILVDVYFLDCYPIVSGKNRDGVRHSVIYRTTELSGHSRHHIP